MGTMTIAPDSTNNLRASEYCRNMPKHTFRSMIEFMDARMSYLLSTGTSAYDACVILYEEIRLRYALPVKPVGKS